MLRSRKRREISQAAIWERGLALEETGVRALRPAVLRGARAMRAWVGSLDAEDPGAFQALRSPPWELFKAEVRAGWLKAIQKVIPAAIEEADALTVRKVRIGKATPLIPAEIAALWAEQHALAMAETLSIASEEGLRALLVEAIREERYPLHLVKDIKPLIGNTARDTRAILRRRRLLLESGMDPRRVRPIIERYADQKLRERAETIARTEVNRARNNATEQVWDRYRKEGLIPTQVHKAWMIAGSNVCGICVRLSGLGPIPLGGMWDGGIPHPPAHPRCRCSQALVYPEELG